MEIRNVRLGRSSRKRLGRIPYMGGSVADAVEYGTWSADFGTYDFDEVRRRLSDMFMSFFGLADPDRPAVEDYDANIISYGRPG